MKSDAANTGFAAHIHRKVLKQESLRPLMAEPQSYQRPPQVFISFLGDEFRDNFIRYLVWGLTDERLNVFINREEANRRDIRNLFTKIEDSNIAVVIFSKRYTESEMCLNELQKIHKHAEQNRLVVIPVFYNVSTSDVKSLEGEFGNHFNEMWEKYANDPLKILNLEDSLSSIAERTGLTSEEHGTGLGLVRAIVRVVKRELPNSSGGRRNMSKGQVFVLASAAVFLFSLFIARFFCTDVKVYKAVKCLVGIPVLVGVLYQLYCLQTKSNRRPLAA